VFVLSVHRVPETFVSLRRTDRDVIQTAHLPVFTAAQTLLSYFLKMKIELSRQVFEIFSSTKLDENPSNWRDELLQADGQTDSLMSPYCERAFRATKNTRFILNNFVSKNCVVYEIIWNNKVERGRPQERCDFHAG
jgi:hypothetical protein